MTNFLNQHTGDVRLIRLIINSILLSGTIFANVSSTGPAYTGSWQDVGVYSIDLQTGATSLVVTTGSLIGDVFLLNKNTLYALPSFENTIYEVNLQNNTYRNFMPVPITGAFLNGVAVANNNTAYTVGYTSSALYSVNLQTGAYETITTIVGAGLESIAILNNTEGYVVGYDDDKIYLVNFQTGASSVVAAIPGGSPGEHGLSGIALATSKTAYVVGYDDGTLYKVDLQTGASSLVTTIPDNPQSIGIAINNNTAYTATSTTNLIYATDLLTGLSSIIATIPGAELYGMTILLQMPTDGLSGNNLNFSSYLNANAPIDVIREFALLPEGLGQALESAAPTRNAFLTYASQNSYLAVSQALTDHGRQARFHRSLRANNAIALLADASDKVIEKPPCEQKPYTVWLTPFGEYARQKEQSQTPAFSMGLGGSIAAFEWSSENNNVLGCGAAYVYSHVHEEEGAGQANLNQGFITLYSTLNARHWYFDLGLWGGYYHSNNQRKISFPGVQVIANSHTHGWQMAPHLEVGYDGFWMKNGAIDWFGIEPFLMAEWVANWEHGFQEHGAGNLNMGQEGRFCSLLRGESGLRFHEIVFFNWGELIFQEKGSYAYQKAFDTGHLTAFLVGSPGTFSVITLNSAQNLGVAELSLLFVPKSSSAPNIALRYQGEFGSQYQSHQGMLEISKSF